MDKVLNNDVFLCEGAGQFIFVLKIQKKKINHCTRGNSLARALCHNLFLLLVDCSSPRE